VLVTARPTLTNVPISGMVVDGETVKILRAHVGRDGKVEIDELIAPNRGRMSWSQYVQRCR